MHLKKLSGLKGVYSFFAYSAIFIKQQPFNQIWLKVIRFPIQDFFQRNTIALEHGACAVSIVLYLPLQTNGQMYLLSLASSKMKKMARAPFIGAKNILLH